MAETGKPKARLAGRRFAMTTDSQNSLLAEATLDSWKEIAVYLQRDVSTVMRWEKFEHLPVHRQHHLSRSSVYAYPSELEGWRANRKPLAESTRYKWWRPVPAFASMITLSLALMMVGSGPHVGALVQAADGIVTRQVWTGPGADSYAAAPSPDGRYLSFADTTGDLAVRDLTTGESRRLTNKNSGRENELEFATDSVFSPDGKRVAFAWASQRGGYELDVVGMDGSEPRVLYRREKHDILPADWSPDGKLILASLGRLRAEGNRPWDGQIVTVDAADGSLTILKTFDGNGPDRKRMRFSADGRFVAYDSTADQEGNLDIFALSVSSGQVTPLVQHPAQDKMLGWVPDGKSVLFLSDRTGDWGAWLIAVADGRPQGEPKLVKRNVGAIMPMGFTRDGSFYYGVRDRGYNVYTATLGGGAPSLLVKRFLGGNSEPIWSPDGKSIAYRRMSPADAPVTLCVRSAETGKEREYSLSLRGFIYLQWSPDGKSILMIGTDLQGQNGSYQVDLQTGRLATVHVGRHGSWVVIPRWSADGRAFYYIEPHVEETKRPARVVRRNLGAGRDEEMRLLPEGVTTGWVLSSPDGRQLAMWLIRGQQGSLAVMPTGGTEIRELPGPWTDVARFTLAWRPDSRQILFFRRVGRLDEGGRSELWGVPVDGGEPRSLAFSVPQAVESLSIHPDGKQLAFHVREQATEIWVMENFLPGSEAASKQSAQ
jgi:Tol biopolymer transport system component